jgi:spore coat protein CotH
MHRYRARLLPLAALTLAAACGDAAQVDGPSSGTDIGADTGEATDPGSDTATGDATTATPTTNNPTGDESSSGLDCPANAVPAAPTVLEPLAGRIDVIPAELEIAGSPFVDPDAGDVQGGVEAEIWRVKDGVADERVWHAEVAGGATLTLADGSYDAGPEETLKEYKDYAVRLRYRDEHGPCSAYGEWSPDLAFRTDDGSTALFDDGQILDFYLDIPPDSWQKINAQANPPGCVPFTRDYHTGTLRHAGQTFPGVGIKIKGGCGSSRDLGGKASFKVNLEWDDPEVPGCPEERRLLGEKSFTFNNGVQDNSASNERIGYPIFRALGIPAPRAASVRIFVNDELWGLYTHVETIDRRFLSRWFASKEGMLYEGTYWCDLIPGNVPQSNDDDSGCLTREFTPDACDGAPEPGADPVTYDLIRDLTEQIEALPQGGFYPAIEGYIDWDRFLTTWAIESVIDHWDNYAFTIQNNYRIYHDPLSDRWTMVTTGIDQTFEENQDAWGVEAVLAVRCIEEPACEAAFAARLAEVNDAIEQMDISGHAQAIFDQISPAIMEDPRKEYDFQSFVNEHGAIQSFLEQRPDEIRDQLMQHGF